MNQLKKLVAELKSNEELKSKFNVEQLNFLEEKANTEHPIWDKKIFMTVVYIVGAALLISVLLAGLMIFFLEREVDNFFVMIASVCIGALAGLLAPSPKEQQS